MCLISARKTVKKDLQDLKQLHFPRPIILFLKNSSSFVIRFNRDSVQFSCSVVSDSLQPLEPQHARPPCPSPTPKLMSIESVMPFNHLILCFPFSSCPQSLPASGSFQMSQLFTWGGQSTGVSASASVLPMNTQDLISFKMDWLDLLAVQGTLKSLLQHHSSKASILQCSAVFTVQRLYQIRKYQNALSLFLVTFGSPSVKHKPV